MAMTEEARIRLGIDGGAAAETQLEQISIKLDKIKASLKNLHPSSPEVKEGIKDIKLLNREYKDLSTQLEKSKRFELIIDGRAADASVKELEAAVRKLTASWKTMKENSPEWNATGTQIRNLRAHVADMNGTLKESKGFFGTLTDSVKQFGILAAGYLGFQFITSQISNVIRKNAELSDSIAKIQRTTGESAESVKALVKEVSKIDTRTTRTALADIIAMGGQFNVARDQMVDFVRQVDRVNVVLGDEFKGGAEEVTTQLATLRNVLFDFKTDKIADDIGKLSNALVTLSQDGVATAPVITDMSTRMAGVLIPLGATTSEVLGIAAALQELGVSTERGATAVTKIFQKMSQNVSEFAKVAGKDTAEFRNTINTNIYEAFKQVIEGSNKSSGAATVLAGIIKDLEISGAGASEVFAKFGTNMDLLQRRVDLTNSSLQNTNKINQAFTASNTTFGAELDKLGKKIYGVFTNNSINDFFKGIVTGLNKLLDTTPEFEKLTEEFKRLKESTRELETNIQPLLSRYDELKNKANLNSGEQKELRDIIEKVAKVIPSAISQVDQYGNALGINTDKAKEFIQAQQKLTEFKNKEAIDESEKAIKDYALQIDATTKLLNEMLKTGKRAVPAERGYKLIDITPGEILNVQNQLVDLNKLLEGTKLKIRELKGQPLVDEPTGPKKPKEVIDNKKIQIELTDEEKKKLDEAQKLHEEYVNKIQALKIKLKDIELASINEESEKELAALEVKYLREIELVKKSVQEINHIKGITPEEKEKAKTTGHETELALEEKYQKDRTAIQLKYEQLRTENEINQDVSNLKRQHDDELNVLVNSLFEKKKTQEQYEKDVRVLESRTLAEQLRLTNQYEQQALKNLETFTANKKAELEEQHKEGGSEENYVKGLKNLEQSTSDARLKILQSYGDKRRDIETGITNNSLQTQTRTHQEIVNRELALLDLKLRIAKDGSQEQLDLIKAQIEKERELKVEAANGDAELIAAINEAAAQEIEEATKAHYQRIIDNAAQMFQEFSGYLSSIFQNLNSIQSNRENKMLFDEKQKIDKRKQYYDDLLEHRIISQKEYEMATRQLEDDYQHKKAEAQKAQFKRDQKAAIAAAVVSAASALVQAWSAAKAIPWVYAIYAGLITATTVAEIAKISSEPVPEYKDGGRSPMRDSGEAKGPKHVSGGMEVIDPVTNQPVFKIEGGEFITNADATANNLPLLEYINKEGRGRSISKDVISKITLNKPETAAETVFEMPIEPGQKIRFIQQLEQFARSSDMDTRKTYAEGLRSYTQQVMTLHKTSTEEIVDRENKVLKTEYNSYQERQRSYSDYLKGKEVTTARYLELVSNSTQEYETRKADIFIKQVNRIYENQQVVDQLTSIYKTFEKSANSTEEHFDENKNAKDRKIKEARNLVNKPGETVGNSNESGNDNTEQSQVDVIQNQDHEKTIARKKYLEARNLVNKLAGTHSDSELENDQSEERTGKKKYLEARNLVNKPLGEEPDQDSDVDVAARVEHILANYTVADRTSVPVYTQAQPNPINFAQIRENFIYEKSLSGEKRADKPAEKTVENKASGSAAADPELKELFQNIHQAIEMNNKQMSLLNNRLLEGIEADLVYTKFDRKIKTIQRIQNDAKTSG
jgi:TP901 family phage tail tape measure protein